MNASPYSAAAAWRPNRVRTSGRDCRRNRRVCVFFGCVAGERSRRNAFILEVTFDEEPRSGATLPVHEAQSARGEISEMFDARRIATWQDEPLLPLDETNQAVAAWRKKTQVRRRSLSFAPTERHVKARRIGAPLREFLERYQAADKPQLQFERQGVHGVAQSREREIMARRHAQSIAGGLRCSLVLGCELDSKR